MDARPQRSYAALMPCAPMSATELLATVEAQALAEPRADWIVASDGDNTLWRGDVGEAMFEHALADRALRHEVHGALVAEAERFGVAVPEGDMHQVATALYDAFRAGRYPNRSAFAMMAWSFAGWTGDELARYADDVLERFGFAAACRRELEPVIAWCERRQVPLWLVSASPAAIATAAAARLGLPAERVVAMAPRMVDGVVQSELEGEPTYAEGKLARLRQLTQAPLLMALGDSYYDLALLCEAEIAVAVDPGETLRRRLHELDRRVVTLELGGAGG